MPRHVAIAISATIVIGVAGLLVLTQFGDQKGFEQCSVASVAGSAIGGPFELINSADEIVADVDLIDRPTLIYFGYSFCPDVCPLDMARNAAAVDILAESGVSARPMFITIDPARDTPQIANEYAQNFHPDAIGLSGSATQIEAASKAFKTFYQKQGDDPDYYLMQHTTFSYLVLPEHGFVEFYRQETSPEDVATSVACFAGAA